jgi:hypothetical protein
MTEILLLVVCASLVFSASILSKILDVIVRLKNDHESAMADVTRQLLDIRTRMRDNGQHTEEERDDKEERRGLIGGGDMDLPLE